MTSRELQIFLTVAECGKMSEAARRLYITQSSVSQAIAAIEREYDILLFERLSNGLFLTAEGERLLMHARSFFAVKEDMEDYLQNASHNHHLKVGATVTVGTCVLGPILRRVTEQLHDIDLKVHVVNTRILEEMLLRSEIDVGLVEGLVRDPDLTRRSIIWDEMVLVCPPGHRFFGRTEITPEETAGERMILREEGSGTRTFFETQIQARHLPLRVSWSCCCSEAIRNAVADGFGVSVLSRRLVEEDVRQGRLWSCGIAGIELRRVFAIVYHKNKYLSEEIRCFIAACEDFAKKEGTLICH